MSDYALVFDTETTSVEKPFCYNIGYLVFEVDTGQIVLKRDYVAEQVWHNSMLYTTAYYYEKKAEYISAMKSRKTLMEKFGYICRQLARDIKYYDIKQAYAYNSSFDERVFEYNCDWFKCINPFDNVEILDIRGYFHNVIDNNFKTWCEQNGQFTESGNYSTTAETAYRYITNDLNFIESHTALSDSEIEYEILKYCMTKGCVLGTNYVAKKSIPRQVIKDFIVRQNGSEILRVPCKSVQYRKKANTILLKS